MSIPTMSEIEIAILWEIFDRGEPIGRHRTGANYSEFEGAVQIQLADLYAPVTEHFPELTDEDLDKTTPSGTNHWRGKIRFAMNGLKKKGMVEHRRRGVWAITEWGIAVCEAHGWQ